MKSVLRSWGPALGLMRDVAVIGAIIFGFFYLAGLGWSLAQAVVLHGFMCGGMD